MTTVNCPYCGNPINQAAIDIHKKVCSKRPGVSASASTIKPVAQPVKADSFMELGKYITQHPTPPEAVSKPGPDPFGDTKKVTGQVISSEKQPLASEPPPVVITPVNGTNEVFMPVADQYFMVSEQIIETLRTTELMSHKRPTNLLITGQPGGGKTSLALQFAAKYNRPCVIADFGILQEPQQLFQTTRLTKNGDSVVTDTQESGFVKGIETEGCVVVMDELTRVENERVLNPLMPLLDGRKSAWIDDLRRRVHVADRVIFIATINEGALFCGISSLDMALRDRFREAFMDYLPAKQESDMLVAKTGIPKLIANSLAEFAYVVRTTPAISKKISTRQLLHAAEAYSCGSALWQCVEAAVGNFNDPPWRQQIMEVFSLNIKDPAEQVKWTQKPREDKYAKY